MSSAIKRVSSVCGDGTGINSNMLSSVKNRLHVSLKDTNALKCYNLQIFGVERSLPRERREKGGQFFLLKKNFGLLSTFPIPFVLETLHGFNHLSAISVALSF